MLEPRSATGSPPGAAPRRRRRRRARARRAARRSRRARACRSGPSRARRRSAAAAMSAWFSLRDPAPCRITSPPQARRGHVEQVGEGGGRMRHACADHGRRDLRRLPRGIVRAGRPAVHRRLRRGRAGARVRHARLRHGGGRPARTRARVPAALEARRPHHPAARRVSAPARLAPVEGRSGARAAGRMEDRCQPQLDARLVSAPLAQHQRPSGDGGHRPARGPAPDGRRRGHSPVRVERTHPRACALRGRQPSRQQVFQRLRRLPPLQLPDGRGHALLPTAVELRPRRRVGTPLLAGASPLLPHQHHQLQLETAPRYLDQRRLRHALQHHDRKGQ